MVRVLAFALTALAASSHASLFSSSADVDIVVRFPDANPFGRVTNGGSSGNTLLVTALNHHNEPISLTSVTGQFREAGGKERLLRKTTTLPLRQVIKPGATSPIIPYNFHCENKIGEVGLQVWVDYLDGKNKPHKVLGYDGTVSVVEPKGSWFDLQLISLYLLFSGLVGAGAFYTYETYFAPKKTRRSKPSKSSISTPVKVTPIKGNAAGGKLGSGDEKTYDEAWIPEHHLRSKKTQETGSGASTPRRRGKGQGGLTSGEESGAETKRRQKKA